MDFPSMFLNLSAKVSFLAAIVAGMGSGSVVESAVIDGSGEWFAWTYTGGGT